MKICIGVTVAGAAVIYITPDALTTVFNAVYMLLKLFGFCVDGCANTASLIKFC